MRHEGLKMGMTDQETRWSESFNKGGHDFQFGLSSQCPTELDPVAYSEGYAWVKADRARRRRPMAVLLNLLGILAALAFFFFLINAPYGIFIVPLIAGLYGVARGRKWVPPTSLWHQADELTAIAVALPIILIMGSSLLAFAFRIFVWLAKATGAQITVQSVWEWPTQPSEIATGLLGLDKIVWWLIAVAPLELWLIIITPLLWMAAYKLPYAIRYVLFGKRPLEQPDATN